MKEFLVACVGKPSAGKSSFLNAVSDAAAKVGNFPFTTIKPNHGVAYVPIDCPCKRFGKQEQCAPKHGKCVDGVRMVPLKIMDVAGLVPGASTGEGLGNQFLDDLRTADLLIHVVDSSGTTDASGKVTIGYDPINDIDWLREEIHSWIFNNLWKKWPNITRRHIATAQSTAETLALQFSGYGANLLCCQKTLDRSGITENLETWTEETVRKLVDAFLDERFPTIIALNKIDLPDSDKNIDKIFRKYDSSKIVLTSALAEMFLRKLHSQKFINYIEGTEFFDLADETNGLKPLPETTLARLEKVQDLVLFRYGNTGVTATLQLAVKTLELIPTFPVRNINSFGDGSTGSGSAKEKAGVFRDCLLVKKGTTMGELMSDLLGESKKFCQYIETVGGVRLSESELITPENSFVSFKLSGSE
ncbi:P-loop containing nucleoside triphosphate hydrolase protein [Obelidium mucronatum]|nr:P-loop containing nucleoside triphosphate hydrolase protein [Obelidium mucronatum]